MSLSQRALGYLVSEMEPGILELKGIPDGSLVVEKVHVDKKKRWIYFEVKEAGSMSSFSANAIKKYFYAPYRQIKLNESQRIRVLQFGVGNRINNSRGKIPFGPRRYFYPAVQLQTVS